MSFRRGWIIVGGRKKPYQFASGAILAAEKKFHGIHWGEFHQGPTGRMEIVGKYGSEANDPVIVRQA